jgi:putative phage-type endonuclease
MNITTMNNKVLQLLDNKSQIQQRTADWYLERKKLITATDAASALEANPYKTKVDLLKDKCEPYVETEPLSNNAMAWGTKYEPVAVHLYEKFENDVVKELGLLKHPRHKWLAASPDGVRLNGKLVEIKCVYNRKIRDEEPYMYWVQVQIQLEVCDLEECDLFQCKFYEFKNKDAYIKDNSNHKGINMSNNTEFYWKLEEYSCKTIIRDREWFNKSLPVLHRFHNDVTRLQASQLNKTKKKRKRTTNNDNTNLKKTRSSSFDDYKNYNWGTWVSATETKNYMLNDPLLDWLNMYGGKLNLTSDKETSDSYNFNEYIMRKGKEFEKSIYQNLKNRFGNNIINVANSYEGYSTNKLNKTIEHMRNGVPIIYHGVLHNKQNNTYGIPDLIVRSDYLNGITECENISSKEAEVGCLFNTGWHYRIIEIKYTTLKINNDYIYNIGNIKSYKSQAIIYNDALSTIQEYKSNITYLLGRKIYSTVKHMGFYKLGRINIDDKDSKIKDKTYKAIEWIRNLKINGKDWNINPPSRKELYPNMCNTFDYPWRSVKNEISTKINEITLLWNCGPSDREAAFNKNIFKWNNVSSTTLGFKSNKGKILDGIIKINTQRKHKIKCRTKINNKTGNNIDFYVDFETSTDINNDFDDYTHYNKNKPLSPELKNNTIIFMIGIGWINPNNNKWVFKTFVTDKINFNEEHKIIKEWIQYMKTISTEYNNNIKPVVYHWSPAEVSCYNSSCDRFNIKYGIKWHDLLNDFKKSPITLKGVFNYGLKNVAKKLYENKMISTSWEDNELDGLGAMVATWNCNERILRGNPSKLVDFDEIKEIVKYNEVDCKVLWDINRYIADL